MSKKPKTDLNIAQQATSEIAFHKEESIYDLPFKRIKRYLSKIYINLDAIEPYIQTKFEIEVRFMSSGINPYVLLYQKDRKEPIVLNPFVEVKRKQPEGNWLQLGYKHFDSWKFADGKEMDRDFKQAKRIIMRNRLGFFKYWQQRLLCKL